MANIIRTGCVVGGVLKLGNFAFTYVNTTTGTINISSIYPKYNQITIANIIVALTRVATTAAVENPVSYSYNNTTGIITMTFNRLSSGFPCIADVYII